MRKSKSKPPGSDARLVEDVGVEAVGVVSAGAMGPGVPIEDVGFVNVGVCGAAGAIGAIGRIVGKEPGGSNSLNGGIGI